MQIPGLRIDSDIDGLPWKATAVPGVRWIPLDLAEVATERPGAAQPGQRGASTVLIRMEPGTGYEAHRHLGPESVLVLRGGYRDDLGEYTTGTCANYPAGSCHAPLALGDPDLPTDEDNPACVLYAVASGGIELLGPSRLR